MFSRIKSCDRNSQFAGCICGSEVFGLLKVEELAVGFRQSLQCLFKSRPLLHFEKCRLDIGSGFLKGIEGELVFVQGMLAPACSVALRNRWSPDGNHGKPGGELAAIARLELPQFPAIVLEKGKEDPAVNVFGVLEGVPERSCSQDLVDAAPDQFRVPADEKLPGRAVLKIEASGDDFTIRNLVARHVLPSVLCDCDKGFDPDSVHSGQGKKILSLVLIVVS